VVLAVEVLGGLKVLLENLYCLAVNGLEQSLFGAEGNAVCLSDDSPIPKPLMSTKVSAPPRCDESP